LIPWEEEGAKESGGGVDHLHIIIHPLAAGRAREVGEIGTEDDAILEMGHAPHPIGIRLCIGNTYLGAAWRYDEEKEREEQKEEEKEREAEGGAEFGD